MGEVWAARHRSSGQVLALKRVLSGGGPAFARAFAREVRAVARLDHPGIVRVFDRGEDEDYAPWLAMERADTGLDQRPPQAWGPLRSAIAQMLLALAHAHARGVIHRDLKPSNALWVGERLVLADFGLAWAPEDGGGRAVGSPGFMSPEQAMGKWRFYGPWTDIYALGATAWELTTGGPLFSRPSVRGILKAHVSDEPGEFRPRFEVPAGFEEWLRTCLAKHPRDRFTSAAAARQALPDDGEWVVPTGGPRLGGAALSTMTLSLDGVAPTPLEAGSARALPVPPTWPRDEVERPWVPGLGLGLVALRPVPVTGRERLQTRLWSRLRGIEEGARVTLHGPAGVGKSRLAEWLCWRAAECGAAEVVEVRDGLAESLRRQLRATGLDVASLARHATAQGIALAEPLASWLCWEDMPRSKTQARLALSAIEAWAARGPLILWIDEPDLAARCLLTHLPIPGVLAVVTQREAPAEEEEALAVSPLDEAASRALVARLLRLEGQVTESLVERTQGVPLFAVRLVADWVARGWLVPGEEGFELAPEAHPVLPDDLHALWSQELDRALPGERVFAEALAWVPEPVPRRVVVTLAARLGVAAADADLERLGDAGLVQVGEAGLRFAHGLLRESLRRHLDERDDPEVFGHLGEVLAQEWAWSADAGRCLLRAGRREEARDQLLLAVKRTQRLHNWDKAERLYGELDATLAGVPADHPVHEDIANYRVLQIASQRPQGARAALDRWMAIAKANGWDRTRARVWHGRAGLALVEGQLEQAVRHGEKALARGLAVEDEEVIRAATAVLGSSLIALARLDRAHEVYSLAIERSGDVPDALVALAEIALGQGDVARARAYLDQVKPGADPILRVNRDLITAELCWEEESPEDALVPLRAAQRHLKGLGHDEIVLAQMMEAITLGLLGRWREARVVADTLPDIGGDYGLLVRLARVAGGQREEMAAVRADMAAMPEAATTALVQGARAARRTARTLGWTDEVDVLRAFEAGVLTRLGR